MAYESIVRVIHAALLVCFLFVIVILYKESQKLKLEKAWALSV